MMRFSSCQVFTASVVLLLFCLPGMLIAAPPTQDDVNVYSALCRTGFLSKYTLEGEAGLISRRLLTGQGKLSIEALEDEFPSFKDEKNKLHAIQSYQECIYRYVERFHPRIESARTVPSVIDPSVPLERRREIVFLGNQIEDFKGKMTLMKEQLPDRYYDKRDSREKSPQEDPRILNLENYSRYKAFQSADGIPDFSNLSNNDIVVFCNTYESEVESYDSFYRDYRRVFPISGYSISSEVRRICGSAKRGR